MKRFIFFTVATEVSANLTRLQALFGFHEEVLHVRGLADPRVRTTGWGFGYKLMLLHEFLEKEIENKTLGNEDVLVCLDSNDILPNFGTQWQSRNKREFVETYASLNADICFSAQWFFGPQDRLYSPDSKDMEQRRFSGLCSGAFVGSVSALRFYLTKFSYDWHTDDQNWWICHYFAQTNARWHQENIGFATNLRQRIAISDAAREITLPLRDSGQNSKLPKIKLDWECKLFYNLGLETVSCWKTWHFETKTGRWTNRFNRTPWCTRQLEKIVSYAVWRESRREYTEAAQTQTPFFLHFEGPCGPKFFIWRFSQIAMQHYRIAEGSGVRFSHTFWPEFWFLFAVCCFVGSVVLGIHKEGKGDF